MTTATGVSPLRAYFLSASLRIRLASVASISCAKRLRQRISPPWVWSMIGPLAGSGLVRSRRHAQRRRDEFHALTACVVNHRGNGGFAALLRQKIDARQFLAEGAHVEVTHGLAPAPTLRGRERLPRRLCLSLSHSPQKLCSAAGSQAMTSAPTVTPTLARASGHTRPQPQTAH